jgi:hypothetical protein
MADAQTLANFPMLEEFERWVGNHREPLRWQNAAGVLTGAFDAAPVGFHRLLLVDRARFDLRKRSADGLCWEQEISRPHTLGGGPRRGQTVWKTSHSAGGSYGLSVGILFPLNGRRSSMNDALVKVAFEILVEHAPDLLPL